MSAEPTSQNPPPNTPANPPPSNAGNSIQKRTEELAVFVRWVAELIRNGNWFTLLLLVEAVLLLFCRPEGVVATALSGVLTLPKWYANAFWFLASVIPMAAVGVAVATMPRSLPEQESEEAVKEHRAIKGLRPFTKEDAEIFRRLERQQDLQRCCEALESQSFRFGHLVGESGCGKTSFLQAGLVPLWQERGKRAVYVRFSNQNPLEAVQKAIIKQLQLTAPPTVAPEPRAFIGLLKHVMQENQTPLVLLFDQFEQFFVQARSEAERKPFREVLEVWYAREDLHGIKILFSVRADLCHHLYEIEEWLNYAPSPLEVSRLRCFQPKEAARVLSVIAETEKLAFDRPFVERLMAEELGNRDNGLISPVDLQILASMLNRERVAELRGFNEGTLQKLGGIEGLLRRYLENVIDSRTTPSQQKILVEVLLALVDMERQVRGEVLTIQQLQQKLKDTAKPREVYNATIWLSRADVRLLSPVEQEGSQGYQLVHERAIPALLQLSGKQLTEADKANRLLDKRVNEWLGSSHHSRYLFDLGELFLLRQQKAYLIWGAKQRDKRKLIDRSWQRFYRLMAPIVLAGLLALGIWSGLEYTKAGQLWQMQRHIDQYSEGSDRNTAIAAGALAANGHFQRALELAKAIDDDRSRADAFRAIATAYGNLEQRDRAFTRLKQALTAAENIRNDRSRADAFRAIATTYGNLEQRDRAFTQLKQALTAAENIRDDRSRADALTGIAEVYGKLEDSEQALTLLKQAFTAAENIEGEGSTSRINAFEKIVAAYKKLEAPEQVVDQVKQALTAAKTIEGSTSKTEVLATGKPKEPDQVVPWLEQALTTAETIGDSHLRADALIEIVEVTRQVEEPDQAVTWLEQVLAAAETIEGSKSETDVFRAIAEAAANIDRWRLALQVTRKCGDNKDCRVESLEPVLKVHAEKYVAASRVKEEE